MTNQNDVNDAIEVTSRADTHPELDFMHSLLAVIDDHALVVIYHAVPVFTAGGVVSRDGILLLRLAPVEKKFCLH
jgi:hypothetical protein